MRLRSMSLASGLVLAALAAGCAGPEQEATTTAPPPTAAPTAVATSSTIGTTLPADTHPVFGASWTAVWPADGAEATYRVTWGDDVGDMPARIDYGVEWEGGIWDRLTVGTPALGETGMAWYFDRPSPWALRLGGADAFWVNAGGPNLERARFEEPLVLDLARLPDDSVDEHGSVIVSSGDDEPPLVTLDYPLHVASLGQEALTVPAGAVAGAWHIRITIGFGPVGPAADLWVHPELLLVAWDEAGIFSRIELATPWH